MKIEKMETILRRAAPEVAPLSAERADRVLRNALATVPRRDTNGWRGLFSVAAPGMATAFLLLCFGTVSHAPQFEPKAAPALRAVAVPVVVERENEPAVNRIASVVPGRKPVAVAVSSAVIKGPRRVRRRSATVAAVTAVAASQAFSPAPQVTEPMANADEPFLFVAATGTDATQNGDESLTVTVRTDVPAEVPGRAEVATVQSVAMSNAAENNDTSVPVWAHVAVETGQEPVMTLTALR
ncbi:MAG: hypothetical protein H7Y38_20070 [Armatimonadetes bacterium]|nr:hypothetical protein [Armatimonadota bacterium]